MVLTQLLLAGVLWTLSTISPGHATRTFALLATLLAFISASQDVVVDAYRTNVLAPHERGIGSSLFVMGYRMAMIVSGGIAFIWADPTQGGAWSWPEIYRVMAWMMVVAAVITVAAVPRLAHAEQPTSVARQDLIGFAAVLVAVAFGYVVSQRFGPPIASAVLTPLLSGSTMPAPLQKKWMDLLALVLGLAFTLPLAAWAARAARFETLLGGLRSYFALPGAWPFLGFIVLYKLGDAFALSLMTPFLLQGMGYSTAEVGVVNKVIGLWLTIGGALIGGTLMLRLGLWRSLMLFGILQGASNLGFWWLAEHGRGLLPGLTVPAFDWGFVKLAHATPVDGGLLLVVAVENLTGGMGTAAFLAFLMGLCNQRFTATQFALLSAFASVGRVWVGPLAGVLAESIGWPSFFVVATVLSAPALMMLWALRTPVRALDAGSKQGR